LRTFEMLRKKGYKAYAGLDLGKFRNPSHLAVLVPKAPDLREFVQVGSIWFNRWDYTAQVRYIKRFAAEVLPIEGLCYDDTRSELEGLAEMGELPDYFEPIKFTLDEKWRLASQLNISLEQKRLILLPDERQRRALLAVDNALRAEQSGDGDHGDAFFALALALHAAELWAPWPEGEFRSWKDAEGIEDPGFPTQSEPRWGDPEDEPETTFGDELDWGGVQVF